MKYPVLLVHGAALRDINYGIINYWGRIPDYLRSRGIAVFFAGTDAWGSIEKNAEIIGAEIQKIQQMKKVEKVNIIAHSRGGLEARYLISSMAMDNAVASLTTISTPHRGVKAMNITLEIPDALYRFVSFFINKPYKTLGDKNPNFFTGSRQLSEKICAQFNKQNPDKDRVYYQSYAAHMKHFFSDPGFMLTNLFLRLTDGANDGLCPVESAKWGNFKGVVAASHAFIIDLYRFNPGKTDIPALYLRIVNELSEKGF